MVSGPGSSQARFERGRSRPTSSITIGDQRLAVEVAERHGVAPPGLSRSTPRRRAAPWRAASPPASAAAGPARPRCTCGRSGMSSMRAYFGPGAVGRRSALHLLQRIARQPCRRRCTVEALGDPVAADQAAAEQQERAERRWRPSDGRESRQTGPRIAAAGARRGRAAISDSFCSPSCFCSSSTPSEQSVLTPWPVATYFASVQKRRQNISYKEAVRLHHADIGLAGAPAFALEAQALG